MNKVKELLASGIEAVRQAWDTEPVRVLTVIDAIIVFVFAKFGVPINGSVLLEALQFIVPILASGILTHKKVVPAVKVVSRKP